MLFKHLSISPKQEECDLQDVHILRMELFVCGMKDHALTRDVHLIGASYSFEGRVGVCVGVKWETICKDPWDELQ